MRLGTINTFQLLAAFFSALLLGVDRDTAYSAGSPVKCGNVELYEFQIDYSKSDVEEDKFQINKNENLEHELRNKLKDKQCHLGSIIGGNAGSKECKKIEWDIRMVLITRKRLKETLNRHKNRVKEYEQLLARSLEDCKNSGVNWIPVAVPPGLPCPKYKGWNADEVKCTGIGPLPPAPGGSSAGGPKSPAAGGTSTTKTPSASGGECTQGNTLVGVGCVQ